MVVSLYDYKTRSGVNNWVGFYKQKNIEIHPYDMPALFYYYVKPGDYVIFANLSDSPNSITRIDKEPFQTQRYNQKTGKIEGWKKSTVGSFKLYAGETVGFTVPENNKKGVTLVMPFSWLHSEVIPYTGRLDDNDKSEIMSRFIRIRDAVVEGYNSATSWENTVKVFSAPLTLKNWTLAQLDAAYKDIFQLQRNPNAKFNDLYKELADGVMGEAIGDAIDVSAPDFVIALIRDFIGNVVRSHSHDRVKNLTTVNQFYDVVFGE